MMFAYKNQELNNQEYTSDSDSWPAARQKHSFKQDQLPVLELSDGTKISQSTVIARFAGNRLGLVPESDVKAAEVDEVAEFVQEIFQAANLVVNGLADEDKAKDFKARGSLPNAQHFHNTRDE
jgi:glutathione S-transferase